MIESALEPRLAGRYVAALVTNGFEEIELTDPKRALEEAGATVEIVSPHKGSVRSWKHTRWGRRFPVDQPLGRARPGDYHALLLPGGVMSPDEMRTQAAALGFIRSFFDAAKPVAAICHAPWLLIDAGVVRGRTLTSFPSLQTDLTNAGAHWVDDAVVVDQGLVTSRSPADLPAFITKLLEAFRAGHHAGQVGSPRRRAA